MPVRDEKPIKMQQGQTQFLSNTKNNESRARYHGVEALVAVQIGGEVGGAEAQGRLEGVADWDGRRLAGGDRGHLDRRIVARLGRDLHAEIDLG